MDNLSVRRLNVGELMRLTELFDYCDVNAMLAENAQRIENRVIDIFGLFDKKMLLGELRVMYENKDKQMAARGVRAYLYAFRVREIVQGKGYGKYLLDQVIRQLEEMGYREFTIGVEDDNNRAIHIYETFGFDELVDRKREEYQGSSYEYNLYLKR